VLIALRAQLRLQINKYMFIHVYLDLYIHTSTYNYISIYINMYQLLSVSHDVLIALRAQLCLHLVDGHLLEHPPAK